MPPPLAVIWRTWPQIPLPFTIWAVLSRLQDGQSFRSCSTPQVRRLPARVRLTVARSSPQYLYFIFTLTQVMISWFVYYRCPFSPIWSVIHFCRAYGTLSSRYTFQQCMSCPARMISRCSYSPVMPGVHDQAVLIQFNSVYNTFCTLKA